MDNNLLLARAAAKQNNVEDAKKYYDLARKEEPRSPEAAFFYHYYNVKASDVTEIGSAFFDLCASFSDILHMVALLPSIEERKELFVQIMDSFFPMTDELLKMFNDMDATIDFVKEGRADVNKAGKDAFKGLGERIIQWFGEEEPYIDYAVMTWKKRIVWRHDYSSCRNYKLKGVKLWFDHLEEFIRRYEPTYRMPEFKQNGAFAFGLDAANAPASEPLYDEVKAPWGESKLNLGKEKVSLQKDDSSSKVSLNKNEFSKLNLSKEEKTKVALAKEEPTPKVEEKEESIDLNLSIEATTPKKEKPIHVHKKEPENKKDVWSVLLLVSVIVAWLGLIVNLIIVSSIWGFVPAMFLASRYGYTAGFIVTGVGGSVAAILLVVCIIRSIMFKGTKKRIIRTSISGALGIGLAVAYLALLPTSPKYVENATKETGVSFVLRRGQMRNNPEESIVYPLRYNENETYLNQLHLYLGEVICLPGDSFELQSEYGKIYFASYLNGTDHSWFYLEQDGQNRYAYLNAKTYPMKECGKYNFEFSFAYSSQVDEIYAEVDIRKA